MTETTNRLKHLLQSGIGYLSDTSEAEMGRKPSPEKWSKKEILGHLIDSGINNLQRFTEIQFEPKPYQIRKYNQDELVFANDYQNADFDFWASINNRILNVIKLQTEKTLNYKIEFVVAIFLT